ncbi:class I SAM-dependent methyltransferase [Nocardia sp. NPDC088792]|uniref:class I SAM-dependent methyltransferase n=1 Tax=Nocardia sp. NPDC088792 TaxID=3364332 RepID=UPI0037F87930
MGDSTRPSSESIPPRDGYRRVLAQQEKAELERLSALEAIADPHTIALLERIEVGADWRCTELGAGAGSIARWLARRCPAGRLVATDLDTRFLVDLGANAEVRQHDMRTDDFPAGSFDLVHVRSVLEHLPERDEVLPRLAEWVAPGGWLVIEDAVSTSAASPDAQYRRVMGVVEDTLSRTVGTDLQWARTLPQALSALGFTDLMLAPATLVIGAGGPVDRFWRATLTQLAELRTRTGHHDAADLMALAARLDDPSFVELSYTIIAIAGRRA